MKSFPDSNVSTGPVNAWHTEHVYFGKLLRLLRRELDVFHLGERPRYESDAGHHHLPARISDRYHHPREDEAFRRLAKHCPDMELPLARLHQEHRVIANTGEKALLQINAILEDVVVSREEVEMALATYLVYYENHIAKEEGDILARAAKNLTAADWNAVRDAAPAGHDPVFGDRPEQRYEELRRHIGLEEAT